MKEKEECLKCHEMRYMTRHHVKNELGIKTGRVEFLCRDCHDEVEEFYRLNGMIRPTPPKEKRYPPPKLTSNEKLYLDYINGRVLPYYSLGVNNPPEEEWKKTTKGKVDIITLERNK